MKLLKAVKNWDLSFASKKYISVCIHTC